MLRKKALLNETSISRNLRWLDQRDGDGENFAASHSNSHLSRLAAKRRNSSISFNIAQWASYKRAFCPIEQHNTTPTLVVLRGRSFCCHSIIRDFARKRDESFKSWWAKSLKPTENGMKKRSKTPWNESSMPHHQSIYHWQKLVATFDNSSVVCFPLMLDVTIFHHKMSHNVDVCFNNLAASQCLKMENSLQFISTSMRTSPDNRLWEMRSEV